MYKIHATAVQKYAQRSADNMADVVLMVVLSIQQNWLGVGDQLADVRKHKSESKFLWGNKAKTYAYLMSNKHFIYGQMMAVINSDNPKAFSLMNIFLRVPGLGLPKAGFTCQLVAGLVGCMDVHNIRMYNLDIKDLALAKNPKGDKGIASNNKKIWKYLEICDSYGTENLWNSWCENLATKSARWQDANHVSEVHYTYLIGEY